ncbi:MAG: TatD family hydrolase [Candidatus Staskawiczbacteria bacterium]
MIVDTHSHLSFKAYDTDREEVIKRTQNEGVVCIDVGTKYETSKKVIELAEKNEGIYATIGLHPIHIKTDLMKLKMDENEGGFEPLGEEYDKEKYKNLILADRGELGKNKIVAIGEVGLDYYYKPKGTAKKEEFKQKQKEVFIEQLELAEELNLPVIIHCRMAFDDLYEILKLKIKNQKSKLTGVIHCFTGSWEEAQKFMDLGFYLGINGIVDKFDLTEVLKNVSLDKLVVETDCPYLTPKAEGDKRNEPIFVKHIIQKIANLKGVSFEEVASATTENAKKLFKI